MNMSSVSATRPSVEFSSGTTPKSRVAAIHLLEDGRDAADRDVLDRLAEPLDGGQVAVAVFRPEVGDLEHLLQRPRAAHDLAEDGPDGGLVERALVGLADVLEDFLFAGRRKTSAPWSFLTLPISPASGPAR